MAGCDFPPSFAICPEFPTHVHTHTQTRTHKHTVCPLKVQPKCPKNILTPYVEVKSVLTNTGAQGRHKSESLVLKLDSSYLVPTKM